MHVPKMRILQENHKILVVLVAALLIAGNKCQAQNPGFPATSMDDAFDNAGHQLLDDPMTRDEMGGSLNNNEVFTGAGGGGGTFSTGGSFTAGASFNTGGSFSTGGSFNVQGSINTQSGHTTGGGHNDLFSQQLMDVTRQLQAKPRNPHMNIAQSLKQMLTQFSAYRQVVPPNFHITTSTELDDHCFQTPGQLNRFFNRVGMLFDKVSAETDSAESVNDDRSTQPASSENFIDDFGDEISSENNQLDSQRSLEIVGDDFAVPVGPGIQEDQAKIPAPGGKSVMAPVDDTVTVSQQSGEDETTVTVLDDVLDDTRSEEILARRRRFIGDANFNLAQAMDSMEVDDIECLKNFLSDWEREELCSTFSKTLSGIFSKLYASGFECNDMLEMDDIDDDGLNMQHQIIMETQFRSHPRDTWSDAQVKRLMTFAPNALGEDFIDDLPDNLFRTNLWSIGRIAAGRNSNPSLREAFREKLDDLGLEALSEEGIRQLGPGIMALSLDQLNRLDAKMLLNAKFDDLFDDLDDSGESRERPDVFDDIFDDDDDDMRYAIGQMMKRGFNRTGFYNPQMIARTLPFLNDDVDFIRKLDPEALFEALPQMPRVHFDAEEAVEMLEKLRERNDILLGGQGNVVRRLGPLVRGLHATEIEGLDREDLEDAMDDIKDLDFDNEQAEAIVDQLFDDDMPLDYQGVMRLGKLAKGLSVQHIQQMGPQDLTQLLGFKGIHFSPVKQNAIAEKIRSGGFPVQSIPSLYETFSDDDLEDLFEQDSNTFMDLSIDIDWEPLQAVTVASLFKRHLGTSALRPANLLSLRHVAAGLLPSDLDDITDSDDDVLNLIEVFDDDHEKLNSVQIDTLKEKFMQIPSSQSGDVLPVSQKLALQGATIMAYLDEDDFDKLEFDEEGKTAFLAQVYKMSTKKMSRSHIGYLAKNVMSMSRGQTATPYSQLRALGKTALGLSPTQLKSYGGKAIVDNLDIMRNLPFTKMQAETILDLVEEAEPDWECRSEILARIGALLQYVGDDMDDICEDSLLSSLPSIMKSLDTHRWAVQERIEEGFGREEDDVIDEDGMERLVTHMIHAYNTPSVARQRRSVRARRQASTDTLSCSLVQQLRGSAARIPVEYLQKFPAAQIVTCLAEVGNISDWKQQSVQTLLKGLKSVEGAVSEWREDTVRRAGSLISGMTPSDIQQMRITGVDTLYSIGKHGRMNVEQLKAGVKRWMNLTQKKNAGDIGEGEMASLSEFVCGLEPSDIGQVTDAAFRRSLRVIGRSMSCSQAQITAYVNRLISIYGDNVKLWKPALVAEIGHLLGHLGRDRLQSLTTDQLSLISPVVIQKLPAHAISSFSKHQLKSLGTNQINAMTNEQFYALSDSQRAVVEPKASVAFHHQENGAVPYSSISVVAMTVMAIVTSALSV